MMMERPVCIPYLGYQVENVYSLPTNRHSER